MGYEKQLTWKTRGETITTFATVVMVFLRFGTSAGDSMFDSTQGTTRYTLALLVEYGCDEQTLYLTCPFSTHLEVVRADYGRTLPSSKVCPYPHLLPPGAPPIREVTNCSLDSLEVVKNLCQDKRLCRLKVSSRTFLSDPCPQTGKYLTVSYRCVPYTADPTVVCEGHNLSLACDRGRRLYITTAQYGWDTQIPPSCLKYVGHPLPTLPSVGCLSSTAFRTVELKCQQRRQCTISANRQTFGDICPNEKKYLKVGYVCVPKTLFKKIRSGSDKPGELLDTENTDDSSFIKLNGAATVMSTTLSAYKKANVGEARDVNVSHKATRLREDGNCSESRDHMHSQSDSSLVFSWVNSLTYIKENHEKMILYGLLCASLAFIGALIVFIGRILHARSRKGETTSQQKMNVTEPVLQDVSNEENTYIAAADPSDVAILPYNLHYNRGTTPSNRLNTQSRYNGSNSVFTADANRFNTNSLTVTNPLHTELRQNFNSSPHTTASTALNASPATAHSLENRNTFYENSADDEHTNDDNDIITLHDATVYNNRHEGSEPRPRNNSLFDRHS